MENNVARAYEDNPTNVNNQMQINVAQLLKEGVGSTRSFAFDDELQIDGSQVKLHADLTLVHLKQSVLVKGIVNARTRQTCSRCLQEFDLSLALRIEEEFVQTIDVSTGLPVEITAEPDAFTIDENHIIDMSEAIRQYLLLALPMKPLCQTDCPGLCPVCGTNLKEGDCSCEKGVGDTRWTALKGMLRQAH